MRNELKNENGQRKKFNAIFDRIGKKINIKGYSEETILLRNIVDVEANKIVADHLWFGYTKGFQKLTFSNGDMVEFEARVKVYSKGYVNKKYKINNKKTDYKLSHPTKITLVKPKSA